MLQSESVFFSDDLIMIGYDDDEDEDPTDFPQLRQRSQREATARFSNVEAMPRVYRNAVKACCRALERKGFMISIT